MEFEVGDGEIATAEKSSRPRFRDLARARALRF